MNDNSYDRSETIDGDYRFDRLVDGQLSPDDYRAMLAGLDDEPSGWRRCALAFLEAQALERELGVVRDEKINGSKAVASAATLQSTSYLTMTLAMAACFVLAFGLGMALRTTWNVEENGGSRVAEDLPAARDAESENGALKGSALVGNDSPSSEPLDISPAREPLQNVTLVVGDDDAQAQRFELPVVYYGDVGDAYFESEHSAMSPQMREMLQQSGHRLERTQRFVPVRMGDGQHVVVPVEEVEIVPVGLPAF